VQQFGWWTVFVPHRADPTLGTFPTDTTPAARAEAAIAVTDDESSSDTGRSSSLFEDDSVRRREAAHAADVRGDDVALNRAQLCASRIPNSLPVEAFCRSYDCETFCEAWTVWAIALLHIRSGVVDRTDISYFLCALFGWPHPRETPHE
jgi:hypothetical protein